MTNIRRLLLPLFVIFCLLLPAAGSGAEDCTAQVARLKAENRDLHLQLREAKRALALEKSREQEPGWPQALGGIGVIFGLCGVGMMLSARKRGTQET